MLTCLSRFEHLHLLGEGAPTDASFLTVPLVDSEEKTQKSSTNTASKRTNALQNPAVMAAVRGGSYDSTTAKNNASPLVTPDQINNFISNINLLDQIGIFELNHIFAHSQRLNSNAIVAFVEALCKVAITELQSPTDRSSTKQPNRWGTNHPALTNSTAPTALQPRPPNESPPGEPSQIDDPRRNPPSRPYAKP